MATANDIIDQLGLEPLPGEGGWFIETYRAREPFIPASALPEHGSDRCFSMQIYYLLKAGESSALHRVKSDEVFHLYLGARVKQLQLFEDGSSRIEMIGHDLLHGERPQVVVPAHVWQGAALADESDSNAYALLGCTVAPGFEWVDFELATPGLIDELVTRWPEHAQLIKRLQPESD
ncbi:MAG: cupin domain-containing protein [Planctomycetota bacterium]|nr:cupin domain-containing protein [Planctomycetota bacterium]